MDEIIIFDTEYTAWEGNQERGWNNVTEFKEIVQIGAICINRDTLVEQSFFSVYIRPVRNPKLSKYFTDLTGIRQESVDNDGENFEKVIIRFANWAGERSLYSFGGDEQDIKNNCLLLGLPFAMEANHFFDAKKIFLNAGISLNGLTSGTVVKAFGVEPKERAHTALADARSIAEGLRLLKKRDGGLNYEL